MKNLELSISASLIRALSCTKSRVHLPFLQDVITYLLDKTKAPAQEYANRVLAKLVRLVLVTVVGVSFLAAGLIFLLIAVITYLSQLMQAWLAWGIIGIITALIGTVLLQLLRR